MEQAVLVRRTAREAVADVEPGRLAERLDDLLADVSMAPGALTLLAAQHVDDTVDPTGIAERAAGVQLVYDGLRLTRTLAREEPWAYTADHAGANIDVLAADVLVSRGFYLLARTEAAETAVETVRAFGRNQTRRRDVEADRATLDHSLEADVFELAVVTGMTAVDEHPPGRLRTAVREFVQDVTEPLPDARTLFTGVSEPMARLSAESIPADEDRMSRSAIRENRNG